MNQAQHQLMRIVQKIPVFDRLSLEQAEKIMKASQFRKYAAGETIYDVGQISDGMVVLIKGTLSVLSATGQALGEVGAGKSTGEMGVFTGYKRSATVVAKEECAGLTISRALILQVMEGDRDMKSIILENVVKELSHRLGDANLRLDTLSQAQEQAATSEAKEIVASDGKEAPVDENASAVSDIEDYYQGNNKQEVPETEDGEEADDEMPAAEDVA